MSVLRSQRWLNIQIHKSPEKVKRKHKSKPESHYSPGMVMVDMVGMPRSDHLIDRLVLNEPSIMSKIDNRFRAGLFLR
jgi:hypothetical protein